MGKPKGTLESEIRIAMLLLGQRPQVGALTLRRSHCDDDDLYYARDSKARRGDEEYLRLDEEAG